MTTWYVLGMTTTHIDARAKYLAADWSLQDTVLGRLLGVSRERVRQVRRKLGKPRALHHHEYTRHIVSRLAVVLDWLRADVVFASLEELAIVAGVSTTTVRNAMRLRPVVGLSVCGSLIHPWPLMNWSLPNMDLDAIWGLTHNRAGTNRARHGHRQATWRRQHGAVPTSLAYTAAFRSEIITATSWRRDKAEARERLFAALRGLELGKRHAGVAIAAAAV